MACNRGCCCPTPCCVSPNVSPPRCSNVPPLLPPFCSPSNLPKFAQPGCGCPSYPPACAVPRCRASPCNYPNPAYDPCVMSCMNPCGAGKMCYPFNCHIFPSSNSS